MSYMENLISDQIDNGLLQKEIQEKMSEYTEQEKELIKKHEEHRKSPNAICNDYTDNTPYLDIEKGVKVRATRNGQRYDFRAIAYQGCHFDGKRLDEVVSKALKKIKEFE